MITLQVVYPTAGGTAFDHAYYAQTHLPLVTEHLGAFLAGASVSRGVSQPGGETPPPFHAIATLKFADQAALDAALAVAGPVLADIPKFTDSTPHMMVGEVLA